MHENSGTKKASHTKGRARIGRPKFTLEQHLAKKALYEEPPTYDEAKAILIRVYQQNGPIDAREILNSYKVQKLSALDKKYYGLFIDSCLRNLGEKA